MSNHCNPSEMQQKAICHITGPARVLAGPGSGKTFTVIQRLNYLTNYASVPSEQILCITFTKAAALEMQERYQKQCMAENESGTVQFGTIHSICYHILKESGEFRQYSLIKEIQKRKILEMLLTNKGLSDYIRYDAVTDLLHAIGRRKNGLTYKQEETLNEQQFEQIYGEYQQALTERQLLDFDDMIISALTLLSTNERVRTKWQKRFSYLLVDEFQDINEVQYQIIRILASPQNNLFVVGDDDQAIYGFRGAAPGIMMQFEKDYPDAACLYLTENYRSNEKIVTFAGKVIEKNEQRISKNIIIKNPGGSVTVCYEETRKEEEAKLLSDIRKLCTKELTESAIIVRTNIEADQYISLLSKNNIRFKKKTKKQTNLFNHFIREDFEAFLRFSQEGMRRRDFLKIINKPEMYLARQALTEEIVTQESLLKYYEQNQAMLEKINKFWGHIEKTETMSFSMAIRYFRNIIGYDRYLKEKATNEQEYEILKNIADELHIMMKKQKMKEGCQAFFERMEQEAGNVSGPENKELTEGISVITMHGAKGLEFRHVFLPDVNEGVIPGKQCKSKESIEEERRLLYVAITRAKEALTIYYTKERGRKPSRFINGLIPRQ